MTRASIAEEPNSCNVAFYCPKTKQLYTNQWCYRRRTPTIHTYEDRTCHTPRNGDAPERRVSAARHASDVRYGSLGTTSPRCRERKVLARPGTEHGSAKEPKKTTDESGLSHHSFTYDEGRFTLPFSAFLRIIPNVYYYRAVHFTST